MAAQPEGFPDDVFDRRELQLELAALSSNRERIIAERRGHLINAEQPEVIVAGIQHAIAMMREPG